MPGKKVIVHPDLWAEIEKMSPEDQAAFREILSLFQQAAANVREDASDEEFNAELDRLSGTRSERVDLDTLDEDEVAVIRERSKLNPQ